MTTNDRNRVPQVTCNIAKKGFIGMPSSSPASTFLTWDTDAARNPFQAILRAVMHNFTKRFLRINKSGLNKLKLTNNSI